MTDSTHRQTLYLSDLCQNKPERSGWSLTFGATCADAASVCLEEQSHLVQVTLQVDGIQTLTVELQRNTVDDTVRRFNADLEVATEYGAYGIAALLMPHLSQLRIVDLIRSRIWLAVETAPTRTMSAYAD